MAPPLHIFDLETANANFGVVGRATVENFLALSKDATTFKASHLYRTHIKNQLLQVYGSGLVKDQGWVKPNLSEFAIDGVSTGPYKISQFSKPLFAKALQQGVGSEVERVHQFYSQLEQSISTHGSAQLGGWNVGYDLPALEAATYRRPELAQWQGWIARQHAAGKLQITKGEHVFAQAALDYAKTDPIFHAAHLNKATTPEEVLAIKGWNLEHIAKVWGKTVDSHNAAADVQFTSEVMEAAKSGQWGESFWRSVFTQSAAKAAAGRVHVPSKATQVLAKGFRAVDRAPLGKYGAAYLAGGVVAAGAISIAMAYSRREDRQTHITGLADAGVAVHTRHQLTDFGSGWQGIKPVEPYPDYSRTLRTAAILTGGAALYAGHSYLMRYGPNYAPGLYKAASIFEDLIPSGYGTTFGLSERASSYLPQSVYVPREKLYSNGALTDLGSHFQRLFGDRLDVMQAGTQGFHFKQTTPGNPLLELQNAKGIRVRFAKKGRYTGASYRYNRPLEDRPYKFSNDPNLFTRYKQNFQELIHSQSRKSLTVGGVQVSDMEERFVPFYASFAERQNNIWGRLRNKAENLQRALAPQAFELMERPQQLLAEVGVGLKQGTYNKLFHMPFIGEGGLFNNLMTRRVLPVVGGLAALRYLDYKTGHLASNTAINALTSLNVLRSDITDMIPGARKVTDWYQEEEGGLPQYAPLALPVGGAFLGGMLHTARIWKGDFSGAGRIMRAKRLASSKLLPRPKLLARALQSPSLIEKLKGSWKAFGLPGQGALIGLAAMLPFLPGMLGSRKTGAEARQVYSGDQEVAVKQGRWWEVGSTPFSGTRITAWQPHWSLIAKSHARQKSLYGSEDNYWKHTALLPWNWPKLFRDPYYLEKLHYKDRPYSVTSPAFSNVPIIGPLLAATIGRIVKPVRRMHEDEWTDETDYTLYSTRLEPRGPKVESKLERDVLLNLASHGYKVDTQVKAGKYRLDFVVSNGKGRAVAIEADGVTFHHTPFQKQRDRQREKELVKQGWDISRVSSTKFWLDPESAMEPVYSHLHDKGLYPGSDLEGMDVYSGLYGYAPSKPVEEFTPWHVIKRMAANITEFIGMPGFTAKSLFMRAYPKRQKKDVYLQGSRQMTSTSRGYYERNLGALMAPTAEGYTGYSEPLRRFIQPEGYTPQVNELKNEMPSWMPGDDYLVNFRKGDPYIKADQGYARLPGAGYAALHPEVEGVDPEDYPTMTKMKILADVAPYSREYQKQAAIAKHQAEGKPELMAEYERIAEQVRQTKESTIQVAKRHFTAPTDVIEGTVKRASASGVELEEYPGQVFHFSSVGGSMADLTAEILGSHNKMTKAQAANEADKAIARRAQFISKRLSEGTHIKVVVPKGATDSEQDIQAVIETDGDNINRELIHRGFGVFRGDQGGAEQSAMHGFFGRVFGKITEGLFFQGDDQSRFNPMRYVPTPFHTKLAQERTALSQYVQQEAVGTRMRRWERPVHDFLAPYLRDTIDRLFDIKVIPKDVLYRRDLDTTADMLGYLRGLHLAAEDPANRGKYISQSKRTAIGANLFGSSSYVASLLPGREARYFRKFVDETDPEERKKILEVVPEEVREALQAQWVKKEAVIHQAKTGEELELGSQGKLYTKEELNDYKRAKTKLEIGDYLRSKRIAKFFFTKKFHLPDEPDSAALASNLDYQDVKLKMVQLAGYDEHDFNLFDDRADTLWRKPYVDGAVRELTSGDSRSQDQIRQAVEQMIIAAGNSNPDVRYTSRKAHRSRANVTVHAEEDNDEEDLLTDIRRNKDAA